MKKTKLLVVIAIIIVFHEPSSLFAQGSFQLIPYGSYMFGGKVKFYEGDFKIQDNPSYGLGMDFNMAPDTYLHLSWNQMNTSGNFRPRYGYEDITSDPFDLNIGYIQIGTVREIDMDNIRPFGMFTLGTTYFMPQTNPGDLSLDDSWRFSVALGGGAKIWFSDRVGIRLHGRLMLPMFWGGVGFSFGTGGSGLSVGASTSMVQGDLGAGLVIALGD